LLSLIVHATQFVAYHAMIRVVDRVSRGIGIREGIEG